MGIETSRMTKTVMVAMDKLLSLLESESEAGVLDTLNTKFDEMGVQVKVLETKVLEVDEKVQNSVETFNDSDGQLEGRDGTKGKLWECGWKQCQHSCWIYHSSGLP